MNATKNVEAFALTAVLFFAIPAAAIETATPFADNMVLQRDTAVPVWGRAQPGEKVTVEFAGQKKETVAGDDGRWETALDPMPASGVNRILSVAGRDGAVEFKNVLVGEVWFASGQSNMECPIWGPNPHYRDGSGAAVVSMTRRPLVRYAKNEKIQSMEPRTDLKAKWREFSPESFKDTFDCNLSAVAFYYALMLHDTIGVPVGIVDSSWGGTRIECWTPASGFRTPKKPRSAQGHPWQPSVLWNGMVAGWAPFAMRGFIWYQGCADDWQMKSYFNRMNELYDGWSREFRNNGLKMYFAQLAPFKQSWYGVQLAQQRFANENPNAGMAVTCDLGNYHDIHPNDKLPVARRLLLHALKRDYGFDNIIDDAPQPVAWKIEKGRFVLIFSNAESWYVYNGDWSKAKGFEVAGEDGVFHPARIYNKIDGNGIVAGREIVIGSSKVPSPVRLRYLYAKPWVGSLYSAQSGLPVGPFEIDASAPSAERRGDRAAIGDALKIKELEGYRAVLSADLPELSFRDAGYKLDKSAGAGDFSRVAYVLELERADGSVDWVAASMDAFSREASELGVPALSGASFQQTVSNLVVRSNVASVQEDATEGVIEFFNSNYSPGKGLDLSVGDANVFDSNDLPDGDGKKRGYGSMQLHALPSGATIFAYNNFNTGTADIGIGSRTGGANPDWTFSENARWYNFRRLTVLVK
ncbi:MAG: hypothetical protein IIT98_05245 [Kiritimatiellae bacterium]|nr:hypothetical protein [Kiritimatiellia bacterium]